jgi:hypothetical protein
MKGSIMATENETYRWNGAQPVNPGAVTRTLSNGRTSYLNKGVQRARRAARRLQGEARDALTAPERRRKTARAAGFRRHSDRIRAGK